MLGSQRQKPLWATAVQVGQSLDVNNIVESAFMTVQRSACGSKHAANLSVQGFRAVRYNYEPA